MAANAGSAKRILTELIHDVNSKCGSLKSASKLLKKSSTQETVEFLALMNQEARDLAQRIALCEKQFQKNKVLLSGNSGGRAVL